MLISTIPFRLYTVTSSDPALITQLELRNPSVLGHILTVVRTFSMSHSATTRDASRGDTTHALENAPRYLDHPMHRSTAPLSNDNQPDADTTVHQDFSYMYLPQFLLKIPRHDLTNT